MKSATTDSPVRDALPRVLVIDDDRKLCRLIRDYLAPMGYAVEAVHTGPEGVAVSYTHLRAHET